MPSGLEIRIELEPDVTFHDGRPLTTSDVQFTLDAIRDPHKGVDHLRADARRRRGDRADHVARDPAARSSGRAAGCCARSPRSRSCRCTSTTAACSPAARSSAPGRGSSASNKGGVVHLARNDKYWGGHAGDRRPRVRLPARRRGRADRGQARRARHRARADPGALARAGERARASPRRSGRSQLAPPRLRYLAFNARARPLDDARVRHALALLVDRRAIAKRVFDGLARPALWPIWPGGPVDGAEAPVPDFDPAAARQAARRGGLDRHRQGRHPRQAAASSSGS